MLRNYKPWVAIVTVGFVIAALYLTQSNNKKTLKLEGASLLPRGVVVSEFNLLDHHQQVFSQQTLGEVSPQWRLLFFGFTTCPDICPLEMQKIGQTLTQLKKQGVTPLPQVVFVSVDPERDSLTQIKNYVEYFDISILGVTGENLEIAKLAKTFSASYSRSATITDSATGKKQKYLVKPGATMPKVAGDNYLVNHTSRFFLVSPQGEYVGSFAPPHQQAVLFNDLKLLIEKY